MKKVHIQISQDVHIKAKVISVLKNTTLNEYFERAIAEAISKDKDILNKLKD
ncbi:hypothetical protein ACFLTH_17610 [Bacteroidota bacterium]